MSAQSRRLMPTILDTSFEKSLTARTIRGVYRLVLLVTINATGGALMFTYWLPDWFGWGTKLLAYVAIIGAAVVWLVIVRMICEYLIILFSIHEQIVTIAHNTRGEEMTRDPR